jgi:hypothetical protein
MKLVDIPAELRTGPFTTTTARDSGVSRHVLSGLRIRRVAQGVHELARDDEDLSERDRLRRVLLAAQAAAPDAVASCLTACAIWDLPVPVWPSHAHVCCARQIRRAGIRAHRRLVEGAMTRHGILVTSPVQTFLDVGLEVDAGWHLAIGDAMVAKRMLSADGLRNALAARPPVRGIRAARSTASLVRSGSESPMESLLRWSILADGLPEPALNARVLDDGGWLARVDLSYPDRCIAIEYQGDHHRSDKRQWRGDITRTRALQSAGWLVIFASADDIARPHGIVSSIRAGLIDRGWRPDARAG